ncbi:MAG: alpha/beta hydrolase [Pseudomonadota bacterium]|nr:alpha/beta hydrolase [Pseudomonadota bacterium]
MSKRVVILHGLWMTGLTTQWFAARLRAAGFLPEIFGYHSIVGGPGAAVPRLAKRLRKGGEAHIVAHSLGGLIALEALASEPDLPVSRMVCLGVPLCGSGAAAGLARWPAASLWLGRSADLLRRGCVTWPASVQVGMIAGASPLGLGVFVARFADANDGTVSVAETQTPGLADHVVINASHSGLLFSAEAATQAVEFLDKGRFTSLQERLSGATVISD